MGILIHENTNKSFFYKQILLKEGGINNPTLKDKTPKQVPTKTQSAVTANKPKRKT